jgi:hypothetical protein
MDWVPAVGARNEVARAVPGMLLLKQARPIRVD